MFGAESAGARQDDLHAASPAGSRMRCPTAVLDAGT
jgi:hypothetical protein